MSAKAKIDWGKAKQEYFATKGMSLKDVSRVYGISYSAVMKVSANEGWTGEKKRIWSEAEKGAIEETEGSVKDLLIRHSKIARFLQAGGLRHLRTAMELAEEDPKFRVDTRTLLAMVAEGLKAERELYPKQMQIKGEMDVSAEGLSEALEKAVNNAFEKELRRKPKTRSKAVSKE